MSYFLLNGYRATQRREFLDESIQTAREALELTPAEAPDIALPRLALGSALIRRAAVLRDAASAREALRHLRAAAAKAEGRAELPLVLSGLGGALLVLHEVHQGDRALVQESVEVLERCVAITGEGHQQRDRHELNLSQALLALGRDDDPVTLARSIAFGESALLRIGSHRWRSIHLHALSGLYASRVRLSGDAEDLRRASELLVEAIALTPPDDTLCACLAGVGGLLVEVAGRSGNNKFRAQAVQCFGDAAAIETASANLRARAAWSMGVTASLLGDAEAALEGFSTVVAMLNIIVGPWLRRPDQEREIERYAGAARLAAAWAIHCGRLQRAVELLEHGRGLTVAWRLAILARYDDLRARAPELAADFARVNLALASIGADDSVMPELTFGTAHRIALTRERDELLTRIREIEGFSEFLLAPRFDRLKTAAAGGPVVLVNVSSHRCDALIVTTDDVSLTPLPDLHAADLADRAGLFVAATEIVGLGAGHLDLQLAAWARTFVVGTLKWLWDIVVEPVLDSLPNAAGAAARPRRVWWSPTGDLCCFPLHAAGYPPARDVVGERNALSRVISSYAPTLQSIIQPSARSTSGGSALLTAISRPARTGDRPLQLADEVAAFALRFPSAPVLIEEEATSEAFLTALEEADILHLACHARQVHPDPSGGSIELWDRPVMIREIQRPIGRPARLAMLLACGTARADGRLPGETVTFVTAFRLAGYRHAVGALWPMEDDDASVIAGEIYDVLPSPDSDRDDGDAIASAVNAAALALRLRFPLAPTRWAGFIHAGP